MRSFYNHPTVQELQCTVATLTTEIDVVGIKLFTATDRQTLAYINFRTHECSTSLLYAACVIDEKDVKRTRLVVLLVEWLYESNVLDFGCNVTGFKPGLELFTASWILSVHKREYAFPANACFFVCFVIVYVFFCSSNSHFVVLFIILRVYKSEYAFLITHAFCVFRH